MTPDELNVLETTVKKLRFEASQKASDLHDLIEERLITDFEDIPAFADAAYKACKAWSDLNKQLKLEKAKG